MTLYNQNIKFNEFKSYDENLTDLESDFKRIKSVNELQMFVEDVISVTKLNVQHIWIYDGLIDVNLDYGGILKLSVTYLFKDDVLGFYLK